MKKNAIITLEMLLYERRAESIRNIRLMIENELGVNSCVLLCKN